jgi:hypothetical protein
MIVDYKEEWLLEKSLLFIQENVIILEKNVYLYIIQLAHIQFLKIVFGGVMFGIQKIIELILILIKVFLINLMN